MVNVGFPTLAAGRNFVRGSTIGCASRGEALDRKGALAAISPHSYRRNRNASDSDRSSDLEIDQQIGGRIGAIGQRFPGVITQKRQGQSDLLPFPGLRQDLSENARLPRADLDNGLVGFEFHDKIA